MPQCERSAADFAVNKTEHEGRTEAAGAVFGTTNAPSLWERAIFMPNLKPHENEDILGPQ